ncbi:hypothetical protein, partial [Pseudomonas sp. EA_65y_Pfl2_P78]|uniref:hypothetical protein n=1 Tax=Pseudomonas sp. EA_65y_Pfl2_P78 TaxID=3088695 RepID=UPI0030DA7FCB
EDSNESVCDSLWRSIYQVELVKKGLALRQAVTGPHTKNLTLPLSQVSGPWANDLLAKYHRYLIAKLNLQDIELRSVRLSIRSVVNLLNHAKLASGELPDQSVLEAFWRHSPGQVAAVTGFINFLNKTHNLKLNPRPSERWLKAARRVKAERELVDLFKDRQDVKDFEGKWIVKGLAYFHGIRRANRKSLIYQQASFHEVDGFDVEIGGNYLWIPSADSYTVTHSSSKAGK